MLVFSGIAIALCFSALAPSRMLAQAAYFSGSVNNLGAFDFLSPFGLAVDRFGDVFVANSGNGTVEEIVAGTGTAAAGTINATSTVVAVGSNFEVPTNLAVDRQGDVFVADFAGAAVKEVVAGTGTAASGTVNATSTVVVLGSGIFARPSNVAVDGNGDVFVADSLNHVVDEIVAGTGTAAAGAVDATSTIVSVGSGFNRPYGVDVDAGGDVFVADQGNNAVKEIVAGTGGAASGTVSSASTVRTLGSGFSGPIGVALDRRGNVFVADTNNNALKEIQAGTGAAAIGTVDGTSTVTTVLNDIPSPYSLAVDGSGNIFVYDSSLHILEEIQFAMNFGRVPLAVATRPTLSVPFTFTAAGSIGAPVVLTQGAANQDFTDAGTGSCTANGPAYSYNVGDSCTVDVTFRPTHPGQRYGGVDLVNRGGTKIAGANVFGTGTGPQITFGPSAPNTVASGFAYPLDVAVDGSGNVFVADVGNSAVKEVLAGTGTAARGAIDASSTVVSVGSGFHDPSGVAIDGSGDVFVADSYSNAVKEIVAGTGGAPSGSVNAASTVLTVGSGFYYPFNVAVGAGGDLFVADLDNNAVKKIVAGTGGAASGTVNSASTVITVGGGFYYAAGVAVDGSGDVFVADGYDAAVMEIVAGTGTSARGTVDASSTVVTVGSGFNQPVNIAVDGDGDVFVADGNGNAVEEIVAGTGGAPSGTVTSASTVITVGSGLAYPAAVAVDGSGNIFIADANTKAVKEINISNPPVLTFPTTTNDGTTDLTDGPQSVTIGNNGNAPLTAISPGLSVAAYFTQGSGGGIVPDCTTSFSLDPSTLCNISIEFTPSADANGSVSGSITLTDNNLNIFSSTTQTISLGGAAAVAIVLTPTTLPSTTVGTAYSQTLSASGGTAPYTYSISAGSLPAGTTLNAATGAFTGIPTSAGSFNCTVTAKDADSFSGTQAYTFMVNRATPILAFAAIQPQTYGNAPFTVSASSASTGTIAYSVVNGPATINAGTGTITLTGAGAVTLAASQAATANYTGATVQTTFAVARQATQVTMSTSQPTVNPGQPVTLTATVSAVAAATALAPTGIVTFFDNGSQVGSPVTLTGGSVQLLLPSLPSAATAVIGAIYSGDDNFSGGTSSNSVRVVVSALDFTFTLSSARSGTAMPGTAASYAFALAPLYGAYPGPVSFTVAGLPAGAIASFTPNSVAANGAAAAVRMTIQMPATAAQNRTGNGSLGRGIVLALMLLPLAGIRGARETLHGRMLRLVLLMAGLTATLTGCGSPTTLLPKKTQIYSLTVTAASGTLGHSQTVTLTSPDSQSVQDH